MTVPEKVKAEFEAWLASQNYNNGKWKVFDFLRLPWDMQSGVWKAYLRSVGIEIDTDKAREYYQTFIYHENKIKFKSEVDKNYSKVEQAAIQAGLNLREQQLNS